MNVGQVEFAVIADGLDAVLGKVTELEGTLNGMSSKRYHIGGLQRTAGDLRAVQRQMEHTLVNFGSRMQTLGRTMQNITAPFNNIVRGFTMGIGYRALNKVLDGFTNAFQRADILNTAEARIKELGLGGDLAKKFAIGTNEAATAMENLDQAVQGLPTGLDEIVRSMQVYVGASEDVEKSTKMAIAANNAYIASGVDATRKRFAERQLQNLMSGTELTSQQWDSLRKNIPLALNATAHEMKMTTGEMIDGLKNGRIEAEKFINAFIKVGTEGKVAKSAQIMKQTWEALSSNISIAFSRMGANILNTANDVTKKLTGRTFLQHLLGVDKNGKEMGDGIKGIINDISESAQNWIKAHPEKLVNFLNDLKNFDWKGMLGEMANFAKFWGGFYGGIAKFIGGKNLARLMLWGNMLGKFFTILGGLTRGAAGPLSRLLTGTGLFGIARAIKGFGDVGSSLSSASLSWQGVASKGITVLSFPAIALAISQTAKALKVLDGVDMSFDLIGKVSLIGTVLTTLVVAAAGIGTALASNPVGWAVLIGEGATALSFDAIAGSLLLMANALSAISKAEIPDAGRIKEVLGAMEQIAIGFNGTDPFTAIGKMFDAWAKGVEFGAIKKATEAFQSIKQLGNIKIDEGVITQAKNNFTHLSDFINQIETLINGEGGKGIPGTTTGAGWRSNTIITSSWRVSIDDFSHKITAIASALVGMQGAIDQLNSLKKVNPKSIDVAKIGELADQVDQALAELEAIGEREVKIAIEITSEITGGDEVTKAVQDEIGKIEDAIEGINDKIEKKLNVYITGSVYGGWDLVGLVRARINMIRNRIAGLNGSIHKTISVSTTTSGTGSGNGGGGGGGWGGGHPQIYTGGMVGKRSVFYRQFGGFIPRGTDTVPAMLTPGEWVMNRTAANVLGAKALQKLNHLDIAGAIRELSTRAGQHIVPHGNIVNNTTNNTRNATVNLNNYNGGSMGTVRAGRWAHQLSR